MTFWEEHARAEKDWADQWLDVPPAKCSVCREAKRGVLLGVCAGCLARHDEEANRGRAPLLNVLQELPPSHR